MQASETQVTVEARPGWPVPTPHPVLRIPTAAQLRTLAETRGQEAARALLWEREDMIRLEAEDPFRHGMILESWKRADGQIELLRERGGVVEILVLGGNRASKTEWAALKFVQCLVARPMRTAWGFHTTEKTSNAVQQSRIYRYLPKEWRNVRKGKFVNVTYSQKNGFSDNTFVLPNRSQGWFMLYSADISQVEGQELDLAWCDELVPLDVLQTLRYRLATRAGLLITTFTPIEGYSATVKDYLQGAKTIETAEAPLLPKDPSNPSAGFETVPLLHQCTRPGARVVYFHASENPYSEYDNLVKLLDGAPRKEILTRAYGVPTKAIANKFPRFDQRVHVRAFDQILPALRRGCTWYHVADPCSGRNYFQLWVAAVIGGNHIVVREWPQQNDYIPGVGLPGEWTLPSAKADGERGPAQDPFGFGLNRYVEEFARVETSLACRIEPEPRDDLVALRVHERIMDSRFGNAPTLAASEATTLIEQYAERDIYFIPSPGVRLDEGIDLINNALDFDPNAPIDAHNAPTLVVCDECENLIYALQEWTGLDGAHGACKDPVDVLRYYLLSDPQYLDEAALAPRGGGSY